MQILEYETHWGRVIKIPKRKRWPPPVARLAQLVNSRLAEERQFVTLVMWLHGPCCECGTHMLLGDPTNLVMN